MPFYKFNKQCIMIYFIESLGQIDIAEIHSTAGSYMAVDKFANSIKLMA